MKHYKVGGKAECTCGSKMIHIPRNGWICIKEFNEITNQRLYIREHDDI